MWYIYDILAVQFGQFSISGTKNRIELIDIFGKKKTKIFNFKSVFGFFGSVLQ